MRPSLATDAILDVLLFRTKSFDDLINSDGVFKMDDDYISSMGMRLISP
jgi:hypothetical protein